MAVLVLVACLAAFHVTLRSLARALLIDSPLAYLGLVPAGAVLIAVVRSRRRPDEPDIEDRQLDLIVGLPLLGAAVAGQVLLHARLGDAYWLLRLDLLVLPVFAAGAVALLLGVRTMWRIRLGLVLLALAWPLPWTQMLALVQNHVSELTTGAAALLATPLGLATQAAGSDGSLFSVDHDGAVVRLSVASACAGLNGAVSYLVVGTVLTGLTTGPATRKVLWLAVGTALAWALNLGRILLLFFVAGRWGLTVAMDVLHPVLGLLLSNLGILVMLTVLRRFGLSFAGRRPRDRAPVDPPVPAPPARRRPVPLVGGAALAAAVAASAVANGQLTALAGLGDPVGGVSVVSLADQPLDPPGFGAASLGEISWARQYFGDASTWQRHLLSLSPGVDGADVLRDQPATPVLADIVTTPSLLRLRTYSIEDCYEFHGFDVRTSRQLRLSRDVRATLLSYWDPRDGRDWTALHWERPVLQRSGQVAYQRVVLLLVDTRNRPVPLLEPGPATVVPAVEGLVPQRATTEERVAAVDDLLVRVARGVVAMQEGRAVSPDGVVRLRADSA
jgi:exosortase/archaeosortase family protein